jgi:hypothetical protein
MDSTIAQAVPASLLGASASAAAATQISDQTATDEPTEQLSQIRGIADDVIAGLSATTRLADSTSNSSAGLLFLAWRLQDDLERLLTGKPATTPKPAGPKTTAATASDSSGGQSQSAPIAGEPLDDSEGTALQDKLDDLLELLNDVKRVDSRAHKGRANKARAADGQRDDNANGSKPSDAAQGPDRTSVDR